MWDSRQAKTAGDLPEFFNAASDLLAENLAVRPDKIAIVDHRGTCTWLVWLVCSRNSVSAAISAC